MAPLSSSSNALVAALLLVLAAHAQCATDGLDHGGMKAHKCWEPIEAGPCRGAVPRWAFDGGSRSCIRFSWGGCKPGGNNFRTQRACSKACSSFMPAHIQQAVAEAGDGLPAACGEPLEQGRCRAYLPRWYWSSEEGVCKRFIYSGCGANGNNFFNKAACQAKCMPRERCKLPVAAGPCREFMPSFYYDAASGECRGFVYGGCRGNANRFRSLEHCEETCLE